MTVGIALLALPASRNAQGGISSRLVYSRGEGAAQCPDATALHDAVADRLGYDPFVANAPITVVVDIELEGNHLRARTYVDDEGRVRGAREFVAAEGSCDDIVAAIALAVSIALDPMRTAVSVSPRRESHSAPPSAPRSDASSALSPSPLPAPRAASPEGANVERVEDRRGAKPSGPSLAPRGYSGDVSFAAGGFVSSGSLPSMSAGPLLLARLRPWQFGSVTLQGRLEAPQTTRAGLGAIRAWAWGFALVPCWHFDPVALCAVGSISEAYAEGQLLSSPSSASYALGSVGARAALNWGLTGRWNLHGYVELSLPLARAYLVMDGAQVWDSPVAVAAAGLALAFGQR